MGKLIHLCFELQRNTAKTRCVYPPLFVKIQSTDFLLQDTDETPSKCRVQDFYFQFVKDYIWVDCSITAIFFSSYSLSNLFCRTEVWEFFEGHFDIDLICIFFFFTSCQLWNSMPNLLCYFSFLPTSCQGWG